MGSELINQNLNAVAKDIWPIKMIPFDDPSELFDRQVVLEGKIELWGNPKNPLQTEIVDNTIANKLYH